MPAITNATIKSKLYVGFGILLVLVGIVGFFGLTGSGRINAKAVEINGSVKSASSVSEITQKFHDVQSGLYEAGASIGAANEVSGDRATALRKHAVDVGAGLAKHMDDLEGCLRAERGDPKLTPDDRAQFDAAVAAWNELRPTADAMVVGFEAGKTADGMSALSFGPAAKLSAMSATLGNLLASTETHAADDSASAQSACDTSRTVMLIVVSLGALLGLSIAFFTIRGITGPLRDLRNLARGHRRRGRRPHPTRGCSPQRRHR